MSSRIDIPQENLNCHHILFIKDVKESVFIDNRNCYKTKHTHLSYRFARLNGVIIVTQKSSLSNRREDYIWLDDGTDVIRIVIPQAISSRKDAYLMEKGASLTVFGSVQTLEGSNEIILQCEGFKVDEDGGALTEIYHWLKAVEDRPRNVASSQRNMFYSVSSAPSPNRLLKENFLVSPLRDFTSSNTKYLWSPDHVFATSTPLKLIRENEPAAIIEADDDDDDDDFDEFDTFGEYIDLAAMEAAAFKRLEQEQQQQQQQQQPNKRKYSLSMD